MGIADKNLRHAALAGKLLHFGKNFWIAVDADFVDFFHTHRLQQPFRHGAVRAIWTGINSNGLHDFFQNTNVYDYMGISVILQVFPPYGCKKHLDGLLTINICADAEKP